MSHSISLQHVIFYSTLTTITTGLGAMPFLCMRSDGPLIKSLSNSIAAGMMIAASMGLLMEGIEHSWQLCVFGCLLGLIFIWLSESFLEAHEDIKFGVLSGPSARKSLLFVIVMTMHSFSEGVGIGVSFSAAHSFGIYISVVLAVHNIPEGLAVALVLVPRGESVFKAGLWAIVTSLPQMIMAIPAFIFTNWFSPLLPLGLGFAGSTMVHVSIFELLPEAFSICASKQPKYYKDLPMIRMFWFNRLLPVLVVILSFLGMQRIQTLLHDSLDASLRGDI
jgi:ZIP family zinc transporter